MKALEQWREEGSGKEKTRSSLSIVCLSALVLLLGGVVVFVVGRTIAGPEPARASQSQEKDTRSTIQC